MKISKLQKKIGQFTLQIEELYLESGKVHGLIGTNGCGKTTLSKLIQGILVPDDGRIDYEGLTPRDITMTTQRPYLLHDTVYQNLIYPLKIRGIRPDEAKMDAWLERCGLLQKKNQYARSLSSGEQQKLSFIRALVFDPAFVIVDETLSNLDPDSTELFEQLMREQQTKNKMTWLLISHQLVHVRKICDQVHFMEQGKVLVSGTPEEIAAGIVPDYDRYITSFNRNFHPQEADIFWIDRIPQISEDGSLILDENGEPAVLPDYTLKKILDTQKGNIARYGISKRGNEDG